MYEAGSVLYTESQFDIEHGIEHGGGFQSLDSKMNRSMYRTGTHFRIMSWRRKLILKNTEQILSLTVYNITVRDTKIVSIDLHSILCGSNHQ